MRQRKAKDLEKRLEACSGYLLQPDEKHTNISTFRRGMEGASFDFTENALAQEKRYFENDNELFLEIGCGKGNFIIRKALANPEHNFIGVEGQETVILRALEKAAEIRQRKSGAEAPGTIVGLEMPDGDASGTPLCNLKFMLTFVHDMSDLFYERQLSGIYLNFSDPWPKARHAKRRLTHRNRLRDYAWALKKGGFVEFKTDNDDLYAFTLEEIEAIGYEIVEQTTDLHNSNYDARLTTTEYEDRFREKAKNIHYAKFVV